MQKVSIVVLGLLVFLKVSYTTAAKCNYGKSINADCYGHDIKHFKLNPQQCQAKCNKRCDCVSIQARNGHCWIKNHVCTDKELTSKGKKGFAEWNKGKCADETTTPAPKCDYGKSINADCYGHDIKHFKLNPKQCQAKCNKRCDCVSIQARNGHCWIKNHVCTDKELTSKGKKGFAEWNKGKCTYA